jgi:hypothetical protein
MPINHTRPKDVLHTTGWDLEEISLRSRRDFQSSCLLWDCRGQSSVNAGTLHQSYSSKKDIGCNSANENENGNLDPAGEIKTTPYSIE